MTGKTLEDLATALESGHVTARELVEGSLARIADSGGEGARAFISVDGDGAIAQADFIDGLRKRGAAPSRYAGIPMGVKDLFDVAGEVTRAGSKVLDHAAPASRDAPAIARLKQAGFIAVGRNNMTEFAYSGVGLNPHYGTPLSVWDRDTGRIPGGSSSGAGVSVGEGMVPLAIGSDTGGSCRIPAAFNGIVGYKSTVGRVPTRGVYPLSPTFDSIGPLANSVRCCASADALMSEDWDGRVTARPAAGLRLGIVLDLFFDDVEPAVADCFERSVKKLSQKGVEFREIEFADLRDLPQINASGGIAAVEAFVHHRDRMSEHGEGYDQRVLKRIASGGLISAADLLDLQARRRVLIEMADLAMAGLDGWLVPTTPNVPPAVAAFDTFESYSRLNFLCLRNTFVGNFLTRCAISLPLPVDGGAPVGGMVMAPAGSDHRLFAVAAALEDALV